MIKKSFLKILRKCLYSNSAVVLNHINVPHIFLKVIVTKGNAKRDVSPRLKISSGELDL